MFFSNSYFDKTWMGYKVNRTNACLSFYSFKKCIHCLLNSITLN